MNDKVRGEHGARKRHRNRLIASCARYSREKLKEMQSPYIPFENVPAIRLYAESLKKAGDSEPPHFLGVSVRGKSPQTRNSPPRIRLTPD
jgi:hypothetical protein